MNDDRPSAAGVRIGWTDLPSSVTSWVEGLLGSPVVSASSQPGGFSPGSADRVVTAQGRRAFVKAVSPVQNPRTPQMHRREAEITARLPSGVPAPRLYGSYDDGTWVALVLEDVDGRHPTTPWSTDELHAVLAALDALARRATPAPVAGLRGAEQVLAHDLGGWTRLAAAPPEDLDRWALENLPALRGLAADGLGALAGETLCHLDVRADNVLLSATGVVIVDWPWACRAAAWVDSLAVLLNVEVFGGVDGDRLDAEALVASSRVLHEAPADAVTAVIAGLAGYFLDAARTAPSPGLPTVRRFQRAQGDAALRWLRRRLEPMGRDPGRAR